MSFLLLRAQPSLAALSTTRSPAIRLFTTVHASQKSAPDTVKDTLKSVDRAVSDAAVTGIDKGSKANFRFPVPLHIPIPLFLDDACAFPLSSLDKQLILSLILHGSGNFQKKQQPKHVKWPESGAARPKGKRRS